jgi:hypothetical protein
VVGSYSVDLITAADAAARLQCDTLCRSKSRRCRWEWCGSSTGIMSG